MDVGNVNAKIVLDTGSVESGLAKSEAKLKTFEAAMAKIGERLTSVFDRSPVFQKLQQFDAALAGAGVSTGVFGRAVAALTSPLGLAAAASLALTAGVVSATNAMVANANEVKNLMAVSGLSAEAADNLADTFAILGQDSQAVTQAMFKMAQEIDGGGAGLRRLGVSLKTSAGELKTEGALFLELRDRISQMGTASQRNAALMDIFGRSGRELAAVFSLSRAEFEKWLQEAGDISKWTEKQQASTVDYIRAQAKLGLQWDALKQQVGAVVVPALTEIFGMVSRLIELAKNPIEFVFKVKNEVPADPRRAQRLGSVIPTPDEEREALRGANIFSREDQIVGVTGDQVTRMRDTAFKAAQIEAEARLAAVKQGLDQERALREQVVAENRLTQDEALRADIAGLTILRGETEKFFARMKELNADRETQPEATVIPEIAKNQAAAIAQIDLAITNLRGKLGAEGIKKDLDVWKDSWAKAKEDTADFEGSMVGLGNVFAGQGPLVSAYAKNLEDVTFSLGEGTTATASFADIVPRIGNGLDATSEILRTLKEDLDKATANSVVFGNSFDLLGARSEALQKALKSMIEEGVDLADERVKAIIVTFLRTSSAQVAGGLTEALAAIGAQAQLLGADFDAAGARVSAFQSALAEALRRSKGEITAEVIDLGAKLKGAIQQQQLEQTLIDIFTAPIGAIEKLTTAAIQGTKDIGKAFKDLGQSIVIEFVNRIIREALNPLLTAAARAVAALLGMGGGGVSFASLLGFGTAALGTSSIIGGQEGFDASGVQLGNAATSTSLLGFGQQVGSLTGGLVTAYTAVKAFTDSLLAGQSAGVAFAQAWASLTNAGGITGAITSGVTTVLQSLGIVSAAGVVPGTATAAALTEAAALAGSGAAAAGTAGGAASAMGALGAGATSASIIGLGMMIGMMASDRSERLWIRREQARASAGYRTDMFTRANRVVNLSDIDLSAPSTSDSSRTDLSILGAMAARIRQDEALLRAVNPEVGPNPADYYFGGPQPYEQHPEVFQQAQAFLEQLAQLGISTDDKYFQRKNLDEATAVFYTNTGRREDWDAIFADFQTLLNHYIEVLERSGILSSTAPGAEGKSLDERLFDRAMEGIREVLDRAGFTSDLGRLTAPTGATRDELRALVGEQIEELVRMFMEAPERITTLIDITPYAKEGEKLEDTAKRVAASFAVLGATMKTADQAIATLRGGIPDVAGELARSIETMEQQGQELWNKLKGLNGAEKLTDIEEIANAEQQLHDLIVARYQMEMKAVEQLAATVERLNSVLIQTAQNIANHADLITSAGMAIGDLTAAVIDLAGAMPTVAGKLNALQAAINMWGVQAQRGIAGGRTLQEIQAEGAGLGPVIRASFQQAQAITDPSQRLAALNQVLATLDQAMQQGIANVQSYFAAQRDAAQAAAQQRLGYLEAERAFVQAEASRRQQALADERAAIQAQISAAEEAQRAAEQARQAWQNVADSIRKQLLDLRLGDTAPPDAMGQLRLARSEFAAALDAFRAGGGPESASLVQEMATRLLAAGQNVFTRPSNEWAALFAEVTSVLEEVGAAAEAGAALGPGEQAMIDVRELQARLVEIDAESADIQRQLAEKLAQLQADQDRIAADLTATLASLSADEARAIQQVKDAAREDAIAIATAIWETSQLVAEQAQQAAAQLQAILGEGVSYEQFMAQKNQDMAAALTVVRDDVRALLDETIRQGIARFVPGASYDVGSWNVPRTETALVHQGEMIVPAPEAEGIRRLRATIAAYVKGEEIPTYAEGAMRVKAGLAYLHDDEAVLNKDQAEAYRAGKLGGTTVLAPNITIVDARDPRRTAEEVERVLRRLRRHGWLADE